MLKMTINKTDATVEAAGDALTLIAELANGTAQLIVNLSALMGVDPAEPLDMLCHALPKAVSLCMNSTQQAGEEVKSNVPQAH